MVDDTILSYGVIAIECLILGVLISLCVRSSALRKRAIVVLGSVTPMLLFYVNAWIEFERVIRPAFCRHPEAIIHGNDRGVYEQQQTVHGRVQG